MVESSAKWALGVEYDGGGFVGWQRQSKGRSVQQEMEHALSAVAGHPIAIVGAGRTDSGVHALGQVLHFESAVSRPAKAWIYGVNSFLNADVTVQWARLVSANFHARYQALRRRYRYVIYNHPSRPALWRGKVLWVRRPLDVARMQRALQALPGEHNFAAFRALGCEAKTTRRRIYQASLLQHGPFICIDIEANAFLYKMVRLIVGLLLQIGDGQRPVSTIAQWLHSGRPKQQRKLVAAAVGLFFCAVHYPPHYDLPPAPEAPFGVD